MNQQLIDQLFLAAGQEAKQQGLPVTLTVVDTGGHIRAVLRQEGCSYFALESSRQKAVTASQLQMPSHVMGEVGQKFPALQASFNANPEISGLPGGFPVLWEGVVVGGLGVAGGNFEQDQAVGAAAIAILLTLQ
ncbi:GlcG/HbpS family heme-binding protein [Spirosoma spitsbergense]|uniref:GlcG/HbpS family heme-binding protein n=1 Tax=Spirosoma spitsbergense TaxID=431554 RepID=UPI0003632693|nr:heme-binding protein [Spirosoma spitsbergense]